MENLKYIFKNLFSKTTKGKYAEMEFAYSGI